jgi:hypothetical protein
MEKSNIFPLMFLEKELSSLAIFRFSFGSKQVVGALKDPSLGGGDWRRR